MKSSITMAVYRALKCSGLAAVVAAAGIVQAQVQQYGTETTPQAGTQSSEEKDTMTASDFIKTAMQMNSAEIALAQVAERQAQNQEVKEFARHVRKDHTQANEKLQSVAQKQGISATQPLDEKHQKKLARFNQLSGEEFDKEFAKEMLKSHAKAIGKYQKASEQLDEQEVKQYVQETLPKLRQHLEHGKQVAKTAGVDEATIASISEEATDAVGGTEDESERGTGAGKKEDEQSPERQPDL